MISGATNDLMREEMGKQLHGSHCSPQDTKCIDEHLNAHVDLPSGSTLLAQLRDNPSARIAEMLRIYGFRHLRVNYEDLFLADSERIAAQHGAAWSNSCSLNEWTCTTSAKATWRAR